MNIVPTFGRAALKLPDDDRREAKMALNRAVIAAHANHFGGEQGARRLHYRTEYLPEHDIHVLSVPFLPVAKTPALVRMLKKAGIRLRRLTEPEYN